MYDDALQQTERLTGEVSDAASGESLRMVLEACGLVHQLAAPRFIDPLAEAETGDDADGGSKTDAPSLMRKHSLQRKGVMIMGLARQKASMRRGSKSDKTADVASTLLVIKAKSTPKPPSVHTMLAGAVKGMFLFKHMSAEQLDVMVARMQKVTCAEGKVVMREGDKGDYFYVVQSGTYEVRINGARVHTYHVPEDQKDKPCFGELALMYARPRIATVACTAAGVLWALDRGGFRAAQKGRTVLVDATKVLRQVALLKDVPFASLQKLRDQMREVTFAPGEHAIREGDEGDTLFVVTSGTAVVTKKQATGDQEVLGYLTDNMAFGEQAILEAVPRNASVAASDDGELRCLVLDREAFEAVLGPLKDIIIKEQEREAQRRRETIEAQQAAGLNNADATDFELRLELSNPHAPMYSTQRWCLAYHTCAPDDAKAAGVASNTFALYTLRVESHSALSDAAQQHLLLSEVELARKMHRQLPSRGPGFPPLLATFADASAVTSVFGGRHVATLRRFLSLPDDASAAPEPTGRGLGAAEARFALACVATALGRLHGMRVLCRGVASASLLIDDAGYVVVASLRYGREVASEAEQSYSLAGLPETMSPEMVRGEGHGFGTDWWATGALAFELLRGHSPFVPVGTNGADDLKIAQRISEHVAGGLDFASHASKEEAKAEEGLQDLAQKLMNPDAKARLGATSGFDEVRAHAAFEGIDWEALETGRLSSPLAQRVVDLAKGFAPPPEGGKDLPTFEESGADIEWCSRLD